MVRTYVAANVLCGRQNHSSSGSFGIRSNVTSVGLVIAGGKGTLLQCLDCMLQGIPIVVVDG